MFDKVMGVPVHPLVVHGAVVFVPLLCLAFAAYVLLPRWRSRFDWVLVALAVVAPIMTIVATASGEDLEHALPDLGEKIEPHAELGENTRLVTIILGVAALALWYLQRRKDTGATGFTLPSWALPALGVLGILLAVADLYFVIRTGHSGAKVVWAT